MAEESGNESDASEPEGELGPIHAVSSLSPAAGRTPAPNEARRHEDVDAPDAEPETASSATARAPKARPVSPAQRQAWAAAVAAATAEVAADSIKAADSNTGQSAGRQTGCWFCVSFKHASVRHVAHHMAVHHHALLGPRRVAVIVSRTPRKGDRGARDTRRGRKRVQRDGGSFI